MKRPPDRPTVETAAIRIRGTVYTKPRPARHHNLLWEHPDEHPHPTEDQGFVLSDGRFADRKRAADFAMRSGQIVKLRWPPYLYSEDLW